MEITVPEFSLVVLVGPDQSGKTTFARENFLPSEVLSFQDFHQMTCEGDLDPEARQETLLLLAQVVRRRLARRYLAVVDAPNLDQAARSEWVSLAKRYHCPAVVVVFDPPFQVLEERNRQLPAERQCPPDLLKNQVAQLHAELSGLDQEGFHTVFFLEGPAALEPLSVRRAVPPILRLEDTGPFDIIGDVHGCLDELLELLNRLGYTLRQEDAYWQVTPPENRRAVFLGDLVDRGPRIPEVLRLAMSMGTAGTALVVPGNHDDKLMRYLLGRKVQVKHGLEDSIRQLSNEPETFQAEVLAFLQSLPHHYVLDHWKLVTAHGGMRADLIGRDSRRVRDFALYGETRGDLDEEGLPVRINWAKDYHGSARIIYGHTPTRQPEWLNRTINIDTGCVYGGSLTGLRYPELELVSVKAHYTYAPTRRPFLPAEEKSPPYPVL